ncbi:Ig-like domain-containing protein [Bradyrhizobium sp. BR 1432]|uniref:Ig-like domain-containing protein n=1 Tax=Bradyrhizobium sp. BR 1432 TaxID=3447966 RepID=UPI003EE62DE9
MDINPNGVAGQGASTTIKNCDISGSENGIWLEANGAVIENNYIHNLFSNNGNPDPHIDGIQVPGSNIGSATSENAIIRGNNIDLDNSTANACITTMDAVNFDISNNRFNGGSYVLYFEGTATGSQVVNNVFAQYTYGYSSGQSETSQTYSGNVTDKGVPLVQSNSVQDLVPTPGAASATTTSSVTTDTSAPLSVTIDTKAPDAPTIASDVVNSANQVVLSGNAEANSAIKVYDGTTQVGTATTNSSGAWSVTTSALSAGSHALTAKAADVAGNVSAASTAVDPIIGSGSSGSTGSGTSGSGTSGTGTSGSGTSGTGTSGSGITAPAAPKIASFSTDSGVAGDHITNDKTLTLAGTAAANSTVKVFDGTTQLGTATADANGAWHYTSVALPDGKHSLTATDTVSGVTSKASAVLDVTLDTAAPDAPVLLSDVTSHHRATVTGTAEAGSTIKVYEGTTLLGTAAAGADGHFSVTTSGLKTGSHTFVASATDAAGNTSALSQPIDPPIGSHGGNGTSTVEVTNVRPHWDHTATIKGTADPNSQIKLFDGTTSVGSVTAGDNGKWSFHTSDLAGKTHAFTAEQVDTTGHVVGTSSGEAIIGTGRSNTLTGTTGNDIMVGKRGADTFEFASNFGHDVIKDFAARGPAHDTIEFSKGVFDSFASVLSHAAQSGHDVVIATGSDTLTLKNTQLEQAEQP